MLQELLTIFRPGNPLKKMADDFSEMLDLTCSMTLTAGEIYFGSQPAAENRTAVYKRDVRVNQLERTIRREVVSHLSLGTDRKHIPYSLVLMSLVKDVERLGDYAKNITEVSDFYAGPIPDDELCNEIREIRASVEGTFRAAPEILKRSDREKALMLIQEGKQLARRSDGLLNRIAKANYPSDLTAALVLGVRYYKRIGGHLLNLLTSVVMPLHKIDYFDEDEITPD